jgi:ATP-dependent DNA helicase RecQ
LRGLRKEIAEQRKVPAYVILNDATLRQLARVRPSSIDRMRYISGIGVTKLADYGARFLRVIDLQCQARGLTRDNAEIGERPPEKVRSSSRLNPQRDLAFQLFRQGVALDEIARRTERGRSTVGEYLDEFIREERPASVTAWVSDELYQRIAAAARQVGTERLKPIYLALGEKVSYDDIRIVRAHIQANSGA